MVATSVQASIIYIPHTYELLLCALRTELPRRIGTASVVSFVGFGVHTERCHLHQSIVR